LQLPLPSLQDLAYQFKQGQRKPFYHNGAMSYGYSLFVIFVIIVTKTYLPNQKIIEHKLILPS